MSYRMVKLSTVSLSAAFMFHPALAQDLDLKRGEYVWKSNGNCARLWIEDDLTYIWDKKCDGSVDYRGRNVWIRGSTINIDQAFFIVSDYDENRIAGLWKHRGNSTEGAFERVRP